MSAEANNLCGADYRQRTPERVNQRNGHRLRRFKPRLGTLDIAIPKLCKGSYTMSSSSLSAPAPWIWPSPILWVDALAIRVREDDPTVNVAFVIATGVNENGYRRAAIRLTGAILKEQHDEWAIAQRYMGTASINAVLNPTSNKELTHNTDNQAP